MRASFLDLLPVQVLYFAANVLDLSRSENKFAPKCFDISLLMNCSGLSAGISDGLLVVAVGFSFSTITLPVDFSLNQSIVACDEIRFEQRWAQIRFRVLAWLS